MKDPANRAMAARALLTDRIKGQPRCKSCRLRIEVGASAAVQAEAGVHAGGGVGAAGVAAEGALVGSVD
jgi:hypothetical protein